MSPHRPFTAAALAATCLALLLSAGAGCSRRDAAYPGYLTLRLASNPTTLDPAQITDVTGGSIAAKLFNGLVRFDHRLKIVPDIARSWSIAPDQRTYLFHLRKDVRFSNGRTVTAEDFRRTFERVLDPGTRAPLTWVLDRIEGARDLMAGRTKTLRGIRVLDEQTLQIRLDRPFAPFLALLGMTTASVVPAEEAARLDGDFGMRPIGTGPFLLRSWQHGQDVVLEARSDYFEGPPLVRGIRYRVVPEDLTAVVEFETGRLDVLQIPASEFRRYTTDPAWKEQVRTAQGLNTYYIGLNCGRPPFSDLRMRQAASLAIDRKKMLDTVYEHRGILAAGPIPPALRTYGGLTPGPDSPYPFDPGRARRLVRDAGWENKPFTLYISAEPEILDLAEVVQNYLRQAGMEVRIVQLDWSAFKQAVNRGDGEAFWLSWWADYPDAENFFYPLFHSSNMGAAGNRSFFRDPRFDHLIDQARSTLSPGRRNDLYARAEERIVSQAPWVFLWHRLDAAVVRPGVRGYEVPVLYSVDKGMTVSFDR